MIVPQGTADSIINALKSVGITNPLLHTAVLSSVSTESNFTPQTERSYANTSNVRLRDIFTTRLSNYTDAQLAELKKNDVAFFDAVYGYLSKLGRDNGNTEPGDGYKYRGRGYNQITFKNNYRRFGNAISVDLVNNPDALNNPNIAARALAVFFSESFAQAKRNGLLKQRVGVNDANEVTTKEQAVRVVLQSNAGWGNNINAGFLATIFEKQKQNFDKIAQAVGNNPGTSALSLILLAGVFFLIVRNA